MIKYSILILAIMLSFTSFGQVNNTSPYSYFGIGDFNQQSTVVSSSMGGLGIASNSASQLNFSNPAGNSALSFSTLSMAGKSNFLQVNDGNTIQSASSTSLSYLALGIPLGEKGGFVVGLQPNSNVGYAITEELVDADNEIVEANIYNGNGGTNRFFGNFGYKVYKELSLGIEAEYIFGEIDNNLINQRLNVTLNTRHRLISNLTGGGIKIGAQYQKEIKENLEVKAGATIKFSNNLNANSEEYLYSFNYSSFGIEQPQDTLINNVDVKGKIERPLSWSAGVGIGKPNTWYAGFEYTTQKALNFDESIFLNNTKIKYDASSKLSIGGYWLPKKNSITSYWHRVTYRAGLKLESPGISINTTGNPNEYTAIDDFGISFGLGLPIGNQLSQVNLGFEYGNRGNTTDGLIKENYFNLRLGLNLADKWFQKRKIN